MKQCVGSDFKLAEIEASWDVYSKKGVAFASVKMGPSTTNRKCVEVREKLQCAEDAANLDKRLNKDKWDEKFSIVTRGYEVCATRTDVYDGWGMDLLISCRIVRNEDAICPMECRKPVCAAKQQRLIGGACIKRCSAPDKLQIRHCGDGTVY